MKYCELGKLIKSERDKRGWEQADLAALISKGKQAVSRWENGDSRPRQNDLLKLVNILSGDVDEWLSKAGYQIEEPDLSLSPFLPLNNLSPENFELFCRDLVQNLNSGADVDRYGSQDHRQEGIDLYAKNQSCVLDYQCKRHKQFGPLDVKNAIEATTFPASHHHILLSRRGTPKAKKAMIKYDDWSLWDQEIISVKVRNLPKDDAVRIVDTYFQGWRKRFLGVEEPSPWLTPKEFYQTLQNKRRLFSHGWHFVGRQKELEMLKEFEEQTEIGAIILSGRGGLGKSRLLRAWSEGIKKPIKVIFVSPGYEVTPKDLELLPKGPSFLVIDDAHERVDIVTILNGVARLRPEMKIVISSRPYGLIHLKDDLIRTGIAFDPEKPITLNDLSMENTKNLAEEIFTEFGGEIQYAQRIAEITKDCPLATVLGSRLVSDGQIKPELLNNSDKFSQELFRCFRKVVAGEIGGSDSEAIRDLLNFLSMIQPFNPFDPIFKESAKELLSKPFDKISRNIGALEDGGVLLRRGNQLRIVPDLLADYIRADASYDEKSKMPTGYADRVFGVVQNELATNLLTNISQLDWRLLADGIQSRLLDEVWSNLKNQFLRAQIFLRSEILTLIEKVAYYQPSHALDIVTLALENPTDEVEEDYLQIRISQPSYKIVLEKIPPILRDVAYHYDYLSEALEILKQLAEIDERSTNNYPDHPIRILKDLASYELGKPVRYNEIVADYVIGWLKGPLIERFSPFDILDELLQIEGYQSEARGYTITWKSFNVRPEIVSGLRKRVIDVAFDVIKTQPLKEGLRALKIIDTSLRIPYGKSKQNSPDSDIKAWESGILETLRQLEEIVKDIRLDPFIATEVRSIVSWHSNYSKTITNAAAKRVLNAIPVTSPYEITRALVDSWGWTFEKEDGKAGRNEEALVKWRDDLAKKRLVNIKRNFRSLSKHLKSESV